MATSPNGPPTLNGRTPSAERPANPKPVRPQAPPPPGTKVAQTAPPPPPSGSATSAALSPSQDKPAPPPQPEASADITQLAATTKVPWGKFKGKTLATLCGSDEGCSYLYFMAYKSEPRSEHDKALQSTAVEVVKWLLVQQLEAALAQPDAAMPLLPFGDEKGKRLHQAHPKWVAMLAKKQDADARSFTDLLLYAAARHLQAERGPSSGFKRSGGLSDEQFRELLGELKAIRLAIEVVGRR